VIPWSVAYSVEMSTRVLGVFIVGAVLLTLGISGAAWLAPAGLAVIVIGSVSAWRLDGRSWRELGFSSVSPTVALWVGVVGVGLPLAWYAIGLATGGIERLDEVQGGGLAALVRVVAVVLVEETVYRGVVLRGLGDRLSPLAVVVGSSALFGISHLPGMLTDGVGGGQAAIGAVSWSLFGIALAWTVLRTASLWPAIAFHLGWNLTFSLVGPIASAVAGGSIAFVATWPDWWAGHAAWSPETGVGGLVLVTAAILLVGLVTPRSIHNAAHPSSGSHPTS